LSTVFVLRPSSDKAELKHIFECAGMSVPVALRDSCRIESISIDSESKHWAVRIAGTSFPGSECLDQICTVFQKILKGSSTVSVEFSSDNGDDWTPSDETIEKHWPDVVDRVYKNAPNVGVWLAQARCRADKQGVVVEVPGIVQAEKLTERAGNLEIAQAFSELCGRRPEVRIDVGEFEEPDVPAELDEPAVPVGSMSSAQPEQKAGGSRSSRQRRFRAKAADGAIMGKVICDLPQPISELNEAQKKATVAGQVFKFEERHTRNGLIIIAFAITDKSDSIMCKCFFREDEPRFELHNGQWVKVRGEVQYDHYAREIVLMAHDIVPHEAQARVDSAPGKRVELHLHTKMSSMDSVCDVEDAVALAASWGHPAVAVTDHGVVQAFPDAYSVARKHGIKMIYGVEAYLVNDPDADSAPVYHMTILVKNRDGLRDLYRLVSLSHLRHFYRHPRIPRDELDGARSNLLVGSACGAGELFRAILSGASDDEVKKVASFYDYLEIMPPENDAYLVRSGRLGNMDEVKEISTRIYELGKELGIPVVATGDVHFLDPSDEVYRRILMAGQGYEDADHQAPLYLRTTDEMLSEFLFLGQDASYEVVVANTRRIAEEVENIRPVPDELATPEIDGADEAVRMRARANARDLYGDPLPEVVEKRLERELDAICGNGYAVNYDIAAKLVQKSVSDGYRVGSRGSVGSSFVAAMCGITEVNPLAPHYVCPKCKHSNFEHGHDVESGYDLPAGVCPRCGIPMRKEGQNIPFETFLGFEGDKVPDIDLNFSGEYQSTVHKYAEEIFGADHVFRAGTISTVAEKTAYGFVKAYCESHQVVKRSVEVERLALGCTGVRRTTGQHPGGIMIVPKGRDVHEFTPVQRPANDRNSDVVTTHFDYKTIQDCLLKLDLLGHDDPTMIKMLEDLTGVDASTIPMDDPDTMKIFSGVESLGLDPEKSGFTVGSVGIPEFGTKFVRGMLEETRPTTFGELVRISGLSHGTDVWLNNAQQLIESGQARLSEVIACRDDIMNRLISDEIPPKDAFRIMERVRKGRMLAEGDPELMRKHSVPEWYIDSCNKIKYMFPKAHAVAYVMMAFRIAWFKVHYPKEFYAAHFSLKASDFDAYIATMDVEGVVQARAAIEAKEDATPRERNLAGVLEVVQEGMMRGVNFVPVHVCHSDASRFTLEEEGLRLPLITVPSLGETAASSVIEAREERPFTSVHDMWSRTKLTRTHVDTLNEIGACNGLPETDQLSLF
jgi:DNA polymerase-3 subunit alpha (Gram-positive type)